MFACIKLEALYSSPVSSSFPIYLRHPNIGVEGCLVNLLLLVDAELTRSHVDKEQ